MDGERNLIASRPSFGVLPLVAVTSAAFALTSCGNDTSYKNKLRPPSPINITAAISESGISLSPSKLGAGPILIVVSNQSAASQVATLEVNQLQSSAKSEKTAGLRQSTGPINPQDTAQIQVVVKPDTTYTLKTDDNGIEPAQLRVGGERPSSQNDVLTP
jgi:hypothetical protein